MYRSRSRSRSLSRSMSRSRSRSESPDIIPEYTKHLQTFIFWSIYFYFLVNLIYNKYF